jgi:flagellar biosynthetic protein FliS
MNHRYLDGRVNSASQPELQLLLLEGAIRCARQARQIWSEPARRAEADRLVVRAREIAEELVRSVVLATRPESRRLEEEYAFVFRQLAAAQLNHDAAPLDAALKLLEFHRETWRLACQKLAAPAHSPAPAPAPGFVSAPAAGLSLQA